MAYGCDGNDNLFGQWGNNSFTGGAGNDTLNSSFGSFDWFWYDTNAPFASAAIGIDHIPYFVRGEDKIVLDKTTFTALRSVAGNGFSDTRDFAVVGSEAAGATSNALIVFNTANAGLYYNQNGAAAGFGTGALFATFLIAPRERVTF